ncbi:MAG TPA: Uma2 family endonuclease, partial [Gemmataceae bacterium]|nr:Uma2 family endonuclease [Gemmataceae bacterium]
IRVTPDLAVEVVSPNDLACEVEEKLLEYLNANVPLVWVVYPQSRTVHVYHPDGLGRLLREQDELTGENILPGFRFPVRDLFVPPTPPTANGGPAA